MRLLREPLVHFVLIGLVLFIAGQAYQAHTNTYRIEVTPARAAQLSHRYALQFGAPPDPATLEQLMRGDIRDEILFRQGLASRLDQGDEIVRRRVVQKEQFLIQNLTPPPEPTEAQLRAYYDAHAARYAAAPRTSFSHIYFAVGASGDAAALARARAALAKLTPSLVRAPDRGDPFPDLFDFSAFEPEQTARLFGHTPFADAVMTAPVGQWAGPFRSAYGWHLIRVSARTPGGRISFAEARERVREDALQEAAEKTNREAFDRLARRFIIVRRDRGAKP